MSQKQIKWKQSEDFHLNRRKEVLNSSGVKEEMPFDVDSYQIRNICQSFTNCPYQNLQKLYDISEYLIESNSSLIEFLHDIDFFHGFGNFLNEVSEADDKLILLYILSDLTRLSTIECLALIEGPNLSLKFLKRQIFSNNDDIKRLSLKCLKHFAEDSHECCDLIIKYGFLNEFYTLLIGNPTDTNTILYIEKILTYILHNSLNDQSSLQIDDENFIILRKTAYQLINKNFGEDISCRILYFISKLEVYVDEDNIQNAQTLVQFLATAKNSKCLRYLMNFFVSRTYIKRGSDFPEAKAFFLNGILQIIFENFFNEDDSDPYNTFEMKIDWSSKLIGSIIENVNESIFQFFEIGFFDIFIDFSINGSFKLKSASAYVLSRLLRKITQQHIQLGDDQIDDLNEISLTFVQLIDTDDSNTILNVFDFILNLIEILNDKTYIISLLSEEDIFENIKTIAEQEEAQNGLILYKKAAMIIEIVS